MSIDIRYFTNGEKTAFIVLHTDTGVVEEYEKREDIPLGIRHLFRRLTRAKRIGPDLAMMLGLQKVFYPDWPKMCSNPGYVGKRCVGESCVFCTTPMDWKSCPFLTDREAINGVEIEKENVR